MDTKWRKYSHSLLTKIIVFVLAITCFSSAITIFVNTTENYQGDFTIAFEDNYFQSNEFMSYNTQIIENLTRLIEEYKSEENILKGGTITEDEVTRAENNLFSEFGRSKTYNPNLTKEENYQKFKEVYAEDIAQIKDKLIKDDLREYNFYLRRLKEYQGLHYYVSDGENEFANTLNMTKDDFKAYQAFIIIDKSEQLVYPEEISKNKNYHWIVPNIHSLEQENNIMYIGFSDEFLSSRIDEWQTNKAEMTNSLYQIIALLLGLAVAFSYLIFIVGRKPGEDDKIHLNFIDKLYTDINFVMCFLIIGLWLGIMSEVYDSHFYELIFAITLILGTLGLILVLSLVKHIKNGTFIKHTLTYTVFYKIFKLIQDIYNSGSVGVKVILIVIGYPMLVGLTFFMFPVTIGIGVWLAHKKVKEFQAIKEGVAQVKAGDIKHKIALAGKGEFAQLASDIDTITEGLNKAIDNELKNERLKTELISNVSHDIRTPLTSIITYVDLLKQEENPEKIAEYVNILEEKSLKLKILTDDLFEASKASSGNIPVNYEKIDITSLITQGLGELDDKVQELGLDFKLHHPQAKVYINADGKLLWRAIENLLSNIFKYALQGSRVYIDIEDLDNEVRLVIKNISAYELNISAEELLERFKRGDESRSSQGSGLGLSIAKSLIEAQKGSFNIEIDGDLFKAIIQMPK